jgi:hypothetical protein
MVFTCPFLISLSVYGEGDTEGEVGSFLPNKIPLSANREGNNIKERSVLLSWLSAGRIRAFRWRYCDRIFLAVAVILYIQRLADCCSM